MNNNKNDLMQKLWSVSVILIILTSLISIYQFTDSTVKTYIIYPQATNTAIAVNATTSVIAANPYPSYLPGKGTLALYDPLTKPYLWNNDADSSFGGACQFTNGTYHVRQSKQDRFYTCYPSSDTQTLNFSNFAFEVQMKIIKGSCGGMTFRNDNLTDKLYLFEVCENSFSLVRYRDITDTNAETLTSNFINNLEQSNIIAVVAVKSMITLYVNRQKIDNINDNAYSHGQISLIADDDTSSTEVIYSNVKVWVL